MDALGCHAVVHCMNMINRLRPDWCTDDDWVRVDFLRRGRGWRSYTARFKVGTVWQSLVAEAQTHDYIPNLRYHQPVFFKRDDLRE